MRCHHGVNSGKHLVVLPHVGIWLCKSDRKLDSTDKCYKFVNKTCPACENPVLIACLHFPALLRKECVGVASSYESTSGSFTHRHNTCCIGSMSMRSGRSQVYNC